MRSPHDPRLDAILETLLAFAQHDFTKRAPVTGTDSIDAIATGLNMLAEELDETVASRRDLEAANARLFETGKMAEVGLLAAGVAHEVNNPAAWVRLALGIVQKGHGKLRRHLESEGDLPREVMLVELARLDQLVVDAIEGMQRITTVVDDLRTLSRAGEESFETIVFDELIASCLRLASHRIAAPVTVEIDERNPPVLVANRGRIAQVLTNLLLNASDAMAATAITAGTITVIVANEEGGTLLAVEDAGPGIPAELREQVFAPFFTTKHAGSGMGLGLTIVSRIAQGYGGQVRALEARTPPGARIEVWFPPR